MTTDQRVDWRPALMVAAGTSLPFLIGYGGASYLTSLRGDVGTWYYQWERFIPFVPLMIIPYMSIDLLFVAAPFLCRDRAELKVLAQRLAAVVIGATVCFLIYPLELAVPRPHAEGFFGGIYNWFTQLDRPYNLSPSMHIALRTVLAAHFARHSRGPLRFATHVWFCLIGCSTLLLYQHHVIDVVGGFVLATLVMYALDGQPWRLPKVGGQRFALLYAILAMTLAAPVAWIPKLGWLTLWPAVSCGLIALGYAWLGPAVYRRHDGAISWPARFALGPVLLGQWLSWRHYARRGSAVSQIADGVWIGRHTRDGELKHLVPDRIGAVVDVCVAFDEAASLRAVERLELPILDLTAPTAEQIDAAVAFIETHRRKGVLIHCKAGFSRSAALAAAWLVRSGRAASSTDAFELIRRKRPQLVIRPEIRHLPDDRPCFPPRSQPCPASTI